MTKDIFHLISPYKPCGDQPQAIRGLTSDISNGKRYNTLLGVTGSGKTFTMANVIRNINKPALVISHNKTLAAQLYSEFKGFFPKNAVEYFVSYYDYYQPEAYIPSTDTYIEKDAAINQEIDRLRLSATSSLAVRQDVIIVASVSCIYNLGSPKDYLQLLIKVEKGQEVVRDGLLKRFVELLYERNDIGFKRGTFRVRGEVVDIFPAYQQSAYRIQFFGDEVEKITEFDPVSGNPIAVPDKIGIYPAKHFVISKDRIANAQVTIEQELEERLKELNTQGKLLEVQRLSRRTKFDMEILKEIGYCHGIENYSRHLSGRLPGSRPCTLLDYFSKDFLTIIDESHTTIPQIRGMFKGDKARKKVLVEYGFRLPSALDNRPLKYEEFEKLVGQILFVSATPAEYEKKLSSSVVEQIIRPTGLIDPAIELHPIEGQIGDLISRINECRKRNERTLVTTLTKKMAEELCGYLKETGLRVKYLHSDIKTLERIAILKSLRLNEFDCLVGVNLLREGLDLPEVSIVAILDADKEGFLRSYVSLIQTAGRAARNINGKVVMYADNITGSMKAAIKEMDRRRDTQTRYNKEHNITPKSVEKQIKKGLEELHKAQEIVREQTGLTEEEFDKELVIAELEREMDLAARNLQFEKAAYYRDEIEKIK